MTNNPIISDLIIIGSGLAGMTLACAACEAGLRVTIVEKRDPGALKHIKSDGRVSAIALGSKRFMERYGMWEDIAPHAGPIDHIRIVDDGSPMFLHFDHKLAGDEPVGYMVENYHMMNALYDRMKRYPHLTLLAPAEYERNERTGAGVKVFLKDGTLIAARLLIAADGRGSIIRQQAGIHVNEVEYRQVGIVCNVQHELDHQGVAVEHFMPAGPFAILPMQGGHSSSLVWTEKASVAPFYLTMPEEEIIKHIEQRFAGYLGKLSLISKVYSYPLSLSFTRDMAAQRLALVGDAAHAIHPIAGQGFNLGIRDIIELVKYLEEAQSLGLDLGSDRVLEQYERSRSYDVVTMIAITDGLNRLFSNNMLPVRMATRLGLAAVEAMPPLKKFFMKHAMGMLGE